MSQPAIPPDIDRRTTWQILVATRGDQAAIDKAVSKIRHFDAAIQTNNPPTIAGAIYTLLPGLAPLWFRVKSAPTASDTPDMAPIKRPDPYLARQFLIAAQKLMNTPEYQALALQTVAVTPTPDLAFSLRATDTFLDFVAENKFSDKVRAAILKISTTIIPKDMQEIEALHATQLLENLMIDTVTRGGQINRRELRQFLGSETRRQRAFRHAVHRMTMYDLNEFKDLSRQVMALHRRIKDLEDPPSPNRPHHKPDSPNTPPTSAPS